MFGNNEEKRLLFHCQNRETIYKKAHYLKKTVAVRILSSFSVDCLRFLRKMSSVNSTPGRPHNIILSSLPSLWAML